MPLKPAVQAFELCTATRFVGTATLYAAQVFIYSCASILAFLALQHTVQNRPAPGWLLQEGRLCPTGSLFTTLRTDAAVAASTKNGAFVFNFLWRNIFTRLVGPLVVFPLFFCLRHHSQETASCDVAKPLSCNTAPPSC